jgi:hypothetical protein
LLEALIKRKIESRLLYGEIEKHAQESKAKNFLDFLQKEKKCQEDNLEDLCRKISSKQKRYLSLAKSPCPVTAMNLGQMDLPQLLSEAIRMEQEDYQVVLDLIDDPAWSREKEVLFYVAEEIRVFLTAIERFKENL